MELNLLQKLRDNNLLEVAVDFDGSWVEGYKGLRNDVLFFVDNEKEFSNNKNSCIIISENGELIEKNLKIAYKHFLAQKMSLPYII